MRLATTSLAVALVACAALVTAAELESGLKPGKAVGAFDVLKCSGAPDDGVAVGDQLCYRCKYGAQPMVMVFARTCDDQLAGFAKKLDDEVSEHTDKNLKAFVSLIGEDSEALQASAKELGESNKLANVPVVVPVESENGPSDYGINPEADVTVMIVNEGKVVASHALAKGELNDESIEKLLGDVNKLVE